MEIGFKGEDIGVKIEEKHDAELKLANGSPNVFVGRQEDHTWRIIEHPPQLLHITSNEGQNSFRFSEYSSSPWLNYSPVMNNLTPKPPTPQPSILNPSPQSNTPLPTIEASAYTPFSNAMRRVNPR